MNQESNSTTNTESTESTKSTKAPVNTAAPVRNTINWRQAAANTGMTMGALALVAGGIYAYGKIKK